MGDVVGRSTQPALAAIKLAWWRERLEGLDEGEVPAEPRLQVVASELLPRGISGRQLSELEEGWAALLQEAPDPEAALARGRTLFRMAARLLASDPPQSLEFLETAGALYAAGTLSRRGLGPGGLFATTEIPRVPPGFRALTGLAALAGRDLGRREAEGTPARAWTLLRHRLTGRL